MAPSNDQQRRYSDRWHVGREIPIALIAAMLIQTAIASAYLNELPVLKWPGEI